jgi:hypothetical protein
VDSACLQNGWKGKSEAFCGAIRCWAAVVKLAADQKPLRSNASGSNDHGLVIVAKVRHATVELLEAVFSEQSVMSCYKQDELMNGRGKILTVT